MNGLVRFALGLANVPNELVADIDQSIPGAGRLIAAAKDLDPDLRQLEPILEQMAPHIAALQPLIGQAMPLINRMLPKAKAAYPDIVTLLPTAQKVLAFVEGKKEN